MRRSPRLSVCLSVYVAREVGVHAAVGLAAVSAVFVGRNLMRYGAELLAAGASAADLAVVLRCVGVASLTYTLPIAFLFGVLAGVARLAEDRETLALRTCGLGLRQLGLPVLGLALLVSGLAAHLALDVEPRAKRELRARLASLARSAPLLEAGRFTVVGERTLWVGSRDGPRLERVFAADRSRPDHPVWVFAESGEIDVDPKSGAARLRLRDGDLYLGSRAPDGRAPDGRERRSRIAFQSFDLPLHPPHAAEAGAGRWRLRPKDLSTGELRRAVARWREDPRAARPAAHEVALERRLALPAAPLLFTFSAVPLALWRRRGARSWGVFCCAALVLGYYALLACGQHLAMQGLVSARVGLWGPNAVLLALGLALSAHTSRRPD